MPGQITRFRIDALHHRRTIDVPIQDNILILVGENGTGKSTVANFIYFFLTRQWHRMLTYDFLSISATIDNRDVEITREEIGFFSNPIDPSDARFRSFPRVIARELEFLLSKYSFEDIVANPEIFSERIVRYGLSHSAALEYIARITSDDAPLFSQNIKEIRQFISSAISSQILYLPTYRRIEQDIKAIFPGFDASSTKNASLQDALTQKKGKRSYIELVKFGMEDVQETFQATMDKLKDGVRSDLNNLTGTYLRDVIQRAYRNADVMKITDLDDPTINAIFSRIDKTILPEREQKALRGTISKIKTDDYISEEDKVVAHFLTQLIDLHKNQQEKERDTRDFVRVCNDYLRGKHITYDSMNFKISIEQDDMLHFNKDETADVIDLKMLSSGEKQIISLFAHIYLSGEEGYFVIIDEPELSLSVSWQQRFLPNILDTGRCNGIVAVTHSPFIFDNKLDRYTHSLEEFVG